MSNYLPIIHIVYVVTAHRHTETRPAGLLPEADVQSRPSLIETYEQYSTLIVMRQGLRQKECQDFVKDVQVIRPSKRSIPGEKCPNFACKTHALVVN